MKQVKAIEIEQNNVKFYICSLEVELLKRICSTSIGDIKNSKDVYQRQLNESRTKQIALFAKRNSALFPTAIVLNSKQTLFYDEKTEKLKIPEEVNSFFIVDGQHRIAGIEKSKKNYNLCVVIMNNVNIDIQSELFITINSEQKAVNANVRYNIKSNDTVSTPEKVVRQLAVRLNGDEKSPFFNKIWFDDKRKNKGETKISLSAFCEPICGLIYNSKDYYNFKDLLNENNNDLSKLEREYSDQYREKILWKFYIKDKIDIIHKIFLNYFNAIKKTYHEVWSDSKSIIIKTTGFNAFMILFNDIFKLCSRNDNNFSFNYIFELLSKNKIDLKEFYVDQAGVGRSASKKLYNLLYNKIFDYQKRDDDKYIDYILNSTLDDDML